MIWGRIRVPPRDRMALTQLYRFLQRERMVRKQLYSASTSCLLGGALAASCRAGNFGEPICAFLLWWSLVDLGTTLSLAGPTMWKEEEMHLLDIGGDSLAPTRALWLGDLSDCLESFWGVSSCSVGSAPGFSWCVLGSLRAVLASVGSTGGQLKSISPVLSISLRRGCKSLPKADPYDFHFGRLA